jgi:hypothetical protein
MTFAKDLVYRTRTKIERGPHENQKINANRTWIEITTPTTSYSMTLVGESKCHHHQHTTKTNLPAAPLSTFAPSLTFTCSQTQWLHDAVGAASTPSMWTKKSRSDEKQQIRPCTTAATALPRTVHRRLLQRPPHSGPF